MRLPEPHYRFGVGTLVLRVRAVLGVRQLDDGPWLVVRGVEVYDDGRDGPEREEVLVRVAALPRSAGDGGWVDCGDGDGPDAVPQPS